MLLVGDARAKAVTPPLRIHANPRTCPHPSTSVTALLLDSEALLFPLPLTTKEKAPAMDRTRVAVIRQISTMGCDLFDVGVRHQSTGAMINRTWTPQQTLAYIPWLKHANANDHDIYIRPARHTAANGLVLLDDITAQTVVEMTCEGYAPTVLLETSPSNYQAWIRFTPHPSDGVRAELAQWLAHKFLADINSADCHHYGRLAGFTNRKKKHRRLGRPCWVLLRTALAAATELGPRMLRQAAAFKRRHRTTRNTATSTSQNNVHDARTIYKQAIADVSARYDAQTDWSRADWVAARRLARAGFGQAQIEQMILELSPSLSQRKKRHEADYARRTATKAALP